MQKDKITKMQKNQCCEIPQPNADIRVGILISKITMIKKNVKIPIWIYYFGKRINNKAELLESPRAEIQKYKSTSALKDHNQTQT